MYTVVSLTKNECLSGGNCSYIVRLSVRELHGPTVGTAYRDKVTFLYLHKSSYHIYNYMFNYIWSDLSTLPPRHTIFLVQTDLFAHTFDLKEGTIIQFLSKYLQIQNLDVQLY